jgi:hypothetical protein
MLEIHPSILDFEIVRERITESEGFLPEFPVMTCNMLFLGQWATDKGNQNRTG